MTQNPVKYVHSDDEYSNDLSCKAVVPVLMEMFEPQSVVDVGCGTGNWIKNFALAGIKNYLGIDGEYVSSEKLMFDANFFLSQDLEKPITVSNTFDLVLCLEVAEHLSPGRADTLVEDLTKLSDIVVFSAAIPSQVGQNHINLQYPEYWIGLFSEHNFSCFDILRPLFWNDLRVHWWYRQNLLVFSKRETLGTFLPSPTVQAMISKELYEYHTDRIRHLENRLINFRLIKSTFRRFLKSFLNAE